MKHLFRLHLQSSRIAWQVFLFLLLVALLILFSGNSPVKGQASSQIFPIPANPSQNINIYVPLVSQSPGGADYVLFGWNDLGMHCYNHDFQDLAVLPPYNTLRAQLVKRGDPPQIITTGVRIQYSFPDNKISSTKTDFWTYVNALFGVQLPDNVGLKNKGLADVMDPQADFFIAEGIPLTEFSDSAPTVSYPFQKAALTAKNSLTGATLATLTVVAPVSTEMHCDNCHAAGKNPGGNQARVELNILALHDSEEGTNLLNSRPVLCARCHSSNALGAPGVSGVPSLSNAIHAQHSSKSPTPWMAAITAIPARRPDVFAMPCRKMSPLRSTLPVK